MVNKVPRDSGGRAGSCPPTSRAPQNLPPHSSTEHLPSTESPSLLMFPELGRYNIIKVDNTSDVCYDIVFL